MRRCLTACLLLALGFIHPAAVSHADHVEDLEGSGFALDSSGSGSGDWSEEGEMREDLSSSKGVRTSTENAGAGNKSTIHSSSVLTFDNKPWLAKDSAGFIVVANNKSFLENKDILAAVIAGGVTGAALAAALTAILIYKWHTKDDGYYLGQQRASGEDYHICNREDFVV